MQVKLGKKILSLLMGGLLSYLSPLSGNGELAKGDLVSPIQFQKDGSFKLQIVDPTTDEKISLDSNTLNILQKINDKIGNNVANNSVSSATIESVYRDALLSDAMGGMTRLWNKTKSPVFESPFVKEVKKLQEPTVSPFKADAQQKLWNDVKRYLNFCELAYFDKADFLNIDNRMRTAEKADLDKIKDSIVDIEGKLTSIKEWLNNFNKTNFHSADVAVEGTKNQTQTFARRATMTPAMVAKYDLRVKLGSRLDELANKNLKPDDLFTIDDPEFLKRASADQKGSSFYRIKEFTNAQQILKIVQSELFNELVKLQEERAIKEDKGIFYYAHRMRSLPETSFFKQTDYKVIGVMYRNQNGFSLDGALAQYIKEDALDSKKSDERKMSQAQKGELCAAILKRSEDENVEIVIAFSGSKSEDDWKANLSIDSGAFKLFRTDRGSSAGQEGTYGMKGHQGILNLFGKSLHQSKELLMSLFQSEIAQGKKVRITVTGHSLGGGLSLLMANFLKEKIIEELPSQIQKLIDVKCFSYAAPPIMNQWSAWQILQNLGEGNVFRIWVPGDPVANVSILQDNKSLSGRSLLQRYLGWYHVGTSISLYHIFEISDVRGQFDLLNKWKNHLIESYHNAMREVNKILTKLPQESNDLKYASDESRAKYHQIDEYERMRLFLELALEKLSQQQKEGALYPEITETQPKEIRYLLFNELKEIIKKYQNYAQISDQIQSKSKQGFLTIKEWREITKRDPYFSYEDIELRQQFVIPGTQKKNFINKILVPVSTGESIVLTSSSSSDPIENPLKQYFNQDLLKKSPTLRAKTYFNYCMIKNLVLDRKTPTIGMGDGTSSIRKCADYCWKKYQTTVCKLSKNSSSSTELEDIRSAMCQSNYRDPKVFDFSGNLFNQIENLIKEYNAEGQAKEESLAWRWDNLHIRINSETKK